MYITILRDPVDQFESVFNYMEFIGEVFGLGKDPKKSIQSFLNCGFRMRNSIRSILSDVFFKCISLCLHTLYNTVAAAFH